MFKKITYEIVESENMVEHREAKNVSLEDAIKILSHPLVINVKATKMTKMEYFKKGLQLSIS